MISNQSGMYQAQMHCILPSALCANIRLPVTDTLLLFQHSTGKGMRDVWLTVAERLRIKKEKVSLHNVLGVHDHLGTGEIFFSVFMSNHILFTSLN